MKVRISNGKLRLRNGIAAVSLAAAAVAGGPATAISLVSLPNMIVVQRLGTTRPIPVGYTVTGAAPGEAVEARAIDTNGNGVTAWASVGTTGADGTGAGSIVVPQGADYRLQARVVNSQTLIATDTSKFGVGAVFAFTGQSNAVGFMGEPDKYPTGYKRAFGFHGGTTYKRIGNTNDAVPMNTISGQTGWPGANNSGAFVTDGPVYLMNTLAVELGVPVCLVYYGLGGQKLETWTDGTANNNWEKLKALIVAAGGDCEGAFLYQGESNAAGAVKSNIESMWGILLNQFLTLTGRTTANFKLGFVSLGPGPYYSAPDEMGRYRVWQRDYAKSTSGFFYAGAGHAAVTPADTVHIRGAGASYLGRVLPRSLLAVYGIGKSGAGPYITGATRSGLQVTLAIAHSGGTALTDGDGGNGSALTGFRFFDAGAAGAQIAYTTSIVGNTIVFTLASAPVGALTVDYAVMDCPHGVFDGKGNTYVPASAVFDNVALPNRTVGCLLQPCAAITVIGG